MMSKLQQKRSILLLGLTLFPAFAWADELNQANTAWILTSTALVLFMTLPGLSLFYAGLVRSKNVLSILMQCFAITCLISIMWLAGMYSLIFTDGGRWSFNALDGTGEQGKVTAITDRNNNSLSFI